MTTPIRCKVAKGDKSMRDAMIQLFFVWIHFSTNTGYAFCHNFRVATFMTKIAAIFTLITRSIEKKLEAKSTSHNLVELV